MKIANYLIIYEVVIKQNLRAFLDISEIYHGDNFKPRPSFT